MIKFLLLLLNLNLCFANTLEQWLEKQAVFSKQIILNHISPKDGSRGSVIASPSKFEPDYYYHWVRDAALVTNVLIEEIIDQNLGSSHPYFKKILEYIEFSEKIQNASTLTDLGEPKFYVNGEGYNLPWGRPQNDGPALRSLYLMRLANSLNNQNKNELASRLYKPQLPANSLIKKDLEYIAHHWSETSFDLWEEVNAHHFYTLMVQRQVLLEGSEFALKMDDPYASYYYFHESKKIESFLSQFFDQKNKKIFTSLNYQFGLNYKDSNLDIAVILALLHVGDNSFIKLDNPYLLNTIKYLEIHFKNLYQINNKNLPGTLFGRYPEDQFFGGNPWVLCTLAIAEFYYKNSKNNSSDFDKAENLMKRLQFHARQDMGLNEQIDRVSGYMKAADNLTWSHASFLTALKARNQAPKKFFMIK